MKTRFGRLLLLVFTWLQCLAPLLHAHAGGSDHFGLHLPDSPGMQTTADAGTKLTQQHPASTQQAIGVSQSKRTPQPVGILTSSATQTAGFPLPSPAPMAPWDATGLPAATPPLLSRLLPLPGAPPSL